MCYHYTSGEWVNLIYIFLGFRSMASAQIHLQVKEYFPTPPVLRTKLVCTCMLCDYLLMLSAKFSLSPSAGSPTASVLWQAQNWCYSHQVKILSANFTKMFFSGLVRSAISGISFIK